MVSSSGVRRRYEEHQLRAPCPHGATAKTEDLCEPDAEESNRALCSEQRLSKRCQRLLSGASIPLGG